MVILAQMSAGILIKQVLQDKGLSQVDLAERINISPTQVSRIISGDRGTTIETLLLIAEALNIPKDAMLRAAANMPIDSSKIKKEDWKEELSLEVQALPASTKPVAEKLLDTLLSLLENKPAKAGKKVKSKS